MSKRTPGLPQRPRGFWPTPKEAVFPLIQYLPPRARYGEPMAGNGALIRHLVELWPRGELVWATDLQPEGSGIEQMDVLDIPAADASVSVQRVDLWISNPPWPKTGQDGDPALGIILHLLKSAPCWMLLPWDFAANQYFARIAPFCSDIVPIGRPSWMENGKGGTDNCAWYRFDAQNRAPATVRPRA